MTTDDLRTLERLLLAFVAEYGTERTLVSEKTVLTHIRRVRGQRQRRGREEQKKLLIHPSSEEAAAVEEREVILFQCSREEMAWLLLSQLTATVLVNAALPPMSKEIRREALRLVLAYALALEDKGIDWTGDIFARGQRLISPACAESMRTEDILAVLGVSNAPESS